MNTSPLVAPAAWKVIEPSVVLATSVPVPPTSNVTFSPKSKSPIPTALSTKSSATVKVISPLSAPAVCKAIDPSVVFRVKFVAALTSISCAEVKVKVFAPSDKTLTPAPDNVEEASESIVTAPVASTP